MSNHQPQSAGAGPSSASMNVQHGQGPPPASQSMSQQNLNQIVSLFSLFECFMDGKIEETCFLSK